jgi:hypothetical protein
MTLEQLIKQRISRLESVPNSLLSVIEKEQLKVYAELVKEVSSLEIEDGKLVANSRNFAKINAIQEKLRAVFMGREYVEAIRTFAVQIQSQATINNSILENTIGTFKDDAMFQQTVQAAQRNSLLLLDENAVMKEFIRPLGNILNQSITTGAGFTETVNTFKKSMIGENAIYSKYAGQMVKDAFSVSDSQYMQLVSKAHGIEFYRWSGGEVEDTREFCAERHDKVFHVKEIEAWGAMINTDKSMFSRPAPSPIYTTKSGVKIYWEGQNYDTNSSTILSFRGGFSCRHALVPIATEYVSKADKDRAARLGFFTGSTPA